MLRAQLLDAVLVAGDEILPALRGQLRHAVEPARVELGALVVACRKSSRMTPWLSAEPHQPALVADEALVDVVELLDQRVDARLVEPQRLHLGDDLFLELLVLALLRRARASRCSSLRSMSLVLQAAQPLVGVGDGVEGLEHLGLELGLDGGERHRVLEIVLVHLGIADGGLERRLPRRRAAPAGCGLNGVAAGGAEGGATACGGCGAKPGTPAPRAPPAASPGSAGRRHVLGVGAGIGRFEIDDVAQEDLSLVQLVAPDDDGLEGERALAQAGDHRLAAGLDALGDGDLALARQAARPSPSRADTCAPDRRCARSAPWLRTWPGVFGVTSTSSPPSVSSSSGSSRGLLASARPPRSRRR